MILGVNARLLSAPSLRGWNRYTLNLIAEFPALGIRPILYTDRDLHPTHAARLPSDQFTIRVASTMRYLWWEQRWLPAQCAADAVDVFHTPFHFGMPYFSRCKRVLTLHDAIDQLQSLQSPLADRLGIGTQLTKLYRWIARTRADAIITVSEHAKRELMEHYGFAHEQLTVIAEAADPRFHDHVSEAERARVRRKFDLGSSFIWYVGGCEDRKNVPFLIRAFAEAGLQDTQLILAGGTAAEQSTLSKEIESLNIGDRVRLLGFVDDDDLPALYAEAQCFVYPSRHEGFGLQLCEAMASGCPTFAARASSLPEVLGSGGETFALDDTAELRGLLQRVASDSVFRRDLVDRAIERSTVFSWKRTAKQTLEVYRKAVNSP